MKNSLKIKTINQLGFVVNDIEKTSKIWEQVFDITAFQILERLPEEIIYRGKSEIVQIKNALTRLDSLQIELIEVIHGNCCQSDFLEQEGEGLHHLGIFVDDLDEVLAVVEQQGIEILQMGIAAGSIRFAYLDTTKLFGIILEFTQIGKLKKK